MRGIRAFGYGWNANVRVYMECRRSGMQGMQTSGMRGLRELGYAWNAEIRVRVECGNWGMGGMRTFGYTCMSGLQVSGSMNCVRGKRR